MPVPVLLPLPLPLPLPLRRRLLLLLTLSRPTLQVGVDKSHVYEELLVEVSSGAAAPALLPPLGGRVQFLDSKQLGAAPYLVVHYSIPTTYLCIPRFLDFGACHQYRLAPGILP